MNTAIVLCNVVSCNYIHILICYLRRNILTVVVVPVNKFFFCLIIINIGNIFKKTFENGRIIII